MEIPVINQTMQNISSSMDLAQTGVGFGISDTMCICLTVLIVSLLVFLIIKETAKRNCWGCKRLDRAEKDIAEIKRQISLNGYFDKQTFINLNAKLDKLSNEVHHHE